MTTVDIYRPPLCLAGADLPEPVTMPFLGGEIVIFTSSSPIDGHDNDCDGTIDDGTFVSGIQYLVKVGIIQVG